MRQYEAISDTVWHGRGALLLTRRDSLVIRSRADSAAATTLSTDSAEKMDAIGSGRGDFVLYVDPRSGVILEATGTTHTEILVTRNNSRFPFREEARQTITLLQ